MLPSFSLVSLILQIHGNPTFFLKLDPLKMFDLPVYNVFPNRHRRSLRQMSFIPNDINPKPSKKSFNDVFFYNFVQYFSILASVYEKNTEPDVPIISYKILYDQVIEHVPPDIETDYVVEVEASSLEQVSKSEQGKVSVEYINPQIETVYANVEEPLTIGNACSSSIPPETETDYIVEVEVDESKNSRQRQKSTTSIKQEIATPYTKFYKSKEKFSSTSTTPEIAITVKVEPDCMTTKNTSGPHEKAKSKDNRSKLEERSKSSKRKSPDNKVASPAKDDKEIDLPFRCCGCECSFGSKPELLQHSKESHASQKTSNRERPFECAICYRRYTSARGFKIHRRNAYQLKQHQCSSCGKRFLHRALLENHERTHTSLKPFQCPSCPKTFRSKSNLLSHQKLHSEIPEHTKHVCKLCNKGFSRKSYLKHHNTLLHSQETPYQCTFCPNQFKAKANLRLHLRTHTQERPYSCELCDKSFMYPTDRKRHMLQHTGQKPFKCKECDKGFTRKTLLRKHQTVHQSGDATGEDDG